MASHPLVIELASVKPADVTEVGPKAARLASLFASGFNVPAGFCITASAYRRFITEGVLQSEIQAFINGIGIGKDGLAASGVAGETLRNKIISSPVSDELAEVIKSVYHSLGSPPVAVRSSAVAEDTETASFAGQQESFLNVVGDNELIAAVRNVWASLWSDRAISYRLTRAEAGLQVPQIAVLIQVMVYPDSSGVTFSIDPLTGETQQAVVNSSWGLGTTIVSGQQDPDSFVMDRRTGKVLDRHVSKKELMSVAVGGTVKDVAISPSKMKRPSLTNSQLQELTRLAGQIEAHFGQPQDIEWAVANSRIYVLQSRPIVGFSWTLERKLTWGSPIRGARWSRISFAEYLPNPATQFFATFLFPPILGAYRSLHKALWLHTFFQMPFLTTINEYLYVRVDFHPTPLALASVLLRVPLKMFMTISQWQNHTLPQLLEANARYPVNVASDLSTSELVTALDSLCSATARYWTTIALTTWLWKISERMFAAFHWLLFPHAGTSYDVLLRGLPSMVWKAEQSLETIADKYAYSAIVREAVKSAESDFEVLENSRDGRHFLQELKHHAEEFGFQTSDLDFVSPTLGERLPMLAKALLRYWGPNAETRHRSSNMVAERVAAEKRALARLRWIPPFAFLFRIVLKLTQNSVQMREDMNFYLTRSWPTIRHLALVLARRFVNQNKLKRPEDVFFLTRDEITAIVHGDKKNEFAWNDLVTQRQKQREWLMAVSAPQNIPVYQRANLVPLALQYMYPELRHHRQGPRELVGVPASKGRISGPACIVRSVDDFYKFKAGDILVAPTTSPVWTPLFSIASAIVTDVGGVLSHASIVAREFGVPAVLGTQSATRKIHDGQLVTVDGNSGIVYFHA